MSRTASVTKYLTQDLFTTNFWKEVDRVTMGILELLLPMINFVGELEPGVGALPLTEVHQQLHNIVAEAGWLTNGLSLTRSCFWIDFPQPGQLWEPRQEHVTDVVWKASKAFADIQDNDDLQTTMRNWKRTRLSVYDALADDATPELETWSSNTYELDNPRPRRVRRTAKIQISMWPFFERSFPYKQDLVFGDFNSGESTTVLQKAQVVYYAGADADAAEQLEDYTLKQYLQDYKRKKAILWGPRAWVYWPFIVVLLSTAIYFAEPSIRAKYDEASHSHWSLPGYVIPNCSWPTWEWPRIAWPSATYGEEARTDSSLSGLPSRLPTTAAGSTISGKESTAFLQRTESSSPSK